jgi:hypothetical protein
VVCDGFQRVERDGQLLAAHRHDLDQRRGMGAQKATAILH